MMSSKFRKRNPSDVDARRAPPVTDQRYTANLVSSELGSVTGNVQGVACCSNRKGKWIYGSAKHILRQRGSDSRSAPRGAYPSRRMRLDSLGINGGTTASNCSAIRGGYFSQRDHCTCSPQHRPKSVCRKYTVFTSGDFMRLVHSVSICCPF